MDVAVFYVGTLCVNPSPVNSSLEEKLAHWGGSYQAEALAWSGQPSTPHLAFPFRDKPPLLTDTQNKGSPPSPLPSHFPSGTIVALP